MTSPAFYFDLTFLSITMLIVGGRSVSGAVTGAASITVMAEFLRRAEYGFSFGSFSLSEAPGLTTIILGLLIVFALALRPKGLFGRWEVDELVFRYAGSRRLANGAERRSGCELAYSRICKALTAVTAKGLVRK
jgi:hypothetical protein